MIADVIFNLPLERSFHYNVPEALQKNLQRGMRVSVPFGRRILQGFVQGLLTESTWSSLKDIRRIIDPVPLLSEEHWHLAAWMRAYYQCSLGEALSAMLPTNLRLKEPSEATGFSKRDTPPAQTVSVGVAPPLTAQQAAAWQILQPLLTDKSKVCLLHGVTGSGKTELYLRSIQYCLEQGQGAICLIPEIALTAQTLERFYQRFGSIVGTWHSRMTQSQRAATWKGLLTGSVRVIVGARSAVFAPVRDLGLIIIDEEHEQTYKQEDTPRYHTRHVAIERMRQRGAVLLGSATPALESFHAAREGHFIYAHLAERIHGRPLPKVSVVDMRTARKRGPVFSLPLHLALEQTLQRNEQVMLLLNRRGFARSAQCLACGHTLMSPGSSIPLVYHATENSLICHHTGYRMPVPEHCPACQAESPYRFRGFGTEKVESELHRLFPDYSIGRMDADTTTARGEHERLYTAVKSQAIQLLVGTQMIAKGLDFGGVTLVGIINADTALNLPDFRAGERTFTLLTQMAGRAGRGELPGRVFIQTHHPEHYAIQTAIAQDYTAFYLQEIESRRRYSLPPFGHLIELTLRSTQEQRLHDIAQALAAALQQALPPETLLRGPAPHRIARLSHTHRLCLTLHAPEVLSTVAVLRKVLDEQHRFQGLAVGIDVDPS